MFPITLKHGGPFVEGTYGFGIGTVKLVAAIAAHVYEADVVEHAQMLGYGWLLKAEAGNDFPYTLTSTMAWQCPAGWDQS